MNATTKVVHERDEDCTLEDGMCTVCGVLHGDPCPACGGRGFHRETCPEFVSRPLRKARFGIDAVEGVLFEGFTAGERWNGFACPYFTKEQASKVLEAFRDVAGFAGSHYDAGRDEFVLGDGQSPEEFERFGAARIGGFGWFYPIGAFGWTWWEEGDFDV